MLCSLCKFMAEEPDQDALHLLQSVSKKSDFTPDGTFSALVAASKLLAVAPPTALKRVMDVLADEASRHAYEFNPSQLSAILNAFAKMGTVDSSGYLKVMSTTCDQLCQDRKALGVRIASVCLNSLAQAELLHEGLLEQITEQLALHLTELDDRQLSMVANALVRLKLMEHTLFPLLWSRAEAVVSESDPQAIGLLVHAYTKTGRRDGIFVQRMENRMMELLEGSLSHRTIALWTYSLHKANLGSEIWPPLILACERESPHMEWSEIANVSLALSGRNTVFFDDDDTTKG